MQRHRKYILNDSVSCEIVLIYQKILLVPQYVCLFFYFWLIGHQCMLPSWSRVGQWTSDLLIFDIFPQHSLILTALPCNSIALDLLWMLCGLGRDHNRYLIITWICFHKTKKFVPYHSIDSWSILGMGKLYLGQALFKSVKSTQVLHFPFVFSLLRRDFLLNSDIWSPWSIYSKSAYLFLLSK